MLQSSFPSGYAIWLLQACSCSGGSAISTLGTQGRLLGTRGQGTFAERATDRITKARRWLPQSCTPSSSTWSLGVGLPIGPGALCRATWDKIVRGMSFWGAPCLGCMLNLRNQSCPYPCWPHCHSMCPPPPSPQDPRRAAQIHAPAASKRALLAKQLPIPMKGSVIWAGVRASVRLIWCFWFPCDAAGFCLFGFLLPFAPADS